jgi:hypothetical protein
MNSLYFTDSLPSILYKPFHSLRKMLFAAAYTFLCLAFSGTAMAQCNTPPTAVADTAITPENRTLWITPLANDFDPDGQPLAVAVLSEDCPGTVATDPTGLLTYMPTPIQGPEQVCSITYSITDGAGGSDTAVVSVTVVAVAPVIFADGFESGDTSVWSTTE